MFSPIHDSHSQEYIAMPKEVSLRFSKDVICKPVIDRFGFKIGKIRDIAISGMYRQDFPCVSGFMVEKKFIKWGIVEKLSRHMTLKESLRKGDICPIPRDSIFIAKKILDEQLMDSSGKSIGRVDDVRFIYDVDSHVLKLAGFYSGASALLMRIGMDIFGNMIPWSCVDKIRNEKPSGIVLNMQRKTMPIAEKYALYEADRFNV